MANWSAILEEVIENGKHDLVRIKYLKKLGNLTKRNIIAYYSGWLQKPNAPEININDNDKNGFMNAIYQLDCSKGLDLLLHTPGGDTAATESLGDYIKSKFNKNVRIIIPQLAMSGGTMLACLGKEIIMGKQSSLGPIDPQFGTVSAAAVIDEFNRALGEVNANTAPIWQQIVAKYPPGFVGECQRAIDWSKSIARSWLETGMFDGDRDAATKINNILEGLKHDLTLSHARHLSLKKCKDIGFGSKIVSLEADSKLQDAVLSVHHAFMITFNQTPAVKIIENQNGKAYVQTHQTLIMTKQ